MAVVAILCIEITDKQLDIVTRYVIKDILKLVVECILVDVVGILCWGVCLYNGGLYLR